MSEKCQCRKTISNPWFTVCFDCILKILAHKKYRKEVEK